MIAGLSVRRSFCLARTACSLYMSSLNATPDSQAMPDLILGFGHVLVASAITIQSESAVSLFQSFLGVLFHKAVF